MTLSACAQRVERGDPDRFAATMAAHPALRDDLFTLYAFNLEIARAPWVTQESMIAEMRLQWWRDVITEPAPRAHDVAAPLHALIGQKHLPLDTVDQMIAARLWDVYSDPFDSAAALDSYIDQTAGHLMWLAALVCGAQAKAEPVVRDVAYALGLANYLTAVRVLEQRGRKPLVDGRASAIAALAQGGLDRLARARRQRGLVGQGAAALLPAWAAGAVLAQIVREPQRVADGRVVLSEFSRRGRLAWAALTGRV